MGKVNRDPKRHRKEKNKAITQKAPSCADGGRAMGIKPRERCGQRDGDRSLKQKPANICCRLGLLLLP